MKPANQNPRAQHRTRVARQAVARRMRRVARLHASWPGELSRRLPAERQKRREKNTSRFSQDAKGRGRGSGLGGCWEGKFSTLACARCKINRCKIIQEVKMDRNENETKTDEMLFREFTNTEGGNTDTLRKYFVLKFGPQGN